MESVWGKDTVMPQFEQLDKNIEADAVVVGGGLAGLLAAYRLKEKGVDAVVLERAKICSGQTKNTTAKITCQHGLIYHRLTDAFGAEKARLYARAHSAAVDELEQIVAKEKINCSFERKPSYLYTSADMQAVENEYKAAQRLGIDSYVTDSIPLPIKIKSALCFKNQAQFNPVEFAAEISKKLKIYENTLAVHNGKGSIKANGKEIRAKHIVIASNYPFIDSFGFYFLRMHRARSYAMAFEGCGEIEGMYYGVDPQALSFRNYGNLLIASGGTHHSGEGKGNEFEMISGKVRAIFPDAREVARWSAQDSMPPDSVPYIGKYSAGKSNFYVATGFQKWGMTSSVVAADIISDMICGRANEYECVFSPQRSISAASGQLISNGIHSVNGLLIKKLKAPSKTLSKLRKGEGAVVNLSGKTVAAYKDENGIIHAVSPNCTHMGCRLTFNSALKSWDCPCHGSRFDIDGRVIDNPSLKNLKRYL